MTSSTPTPTFNEEVLQDFGDIDPAVANDYTQNLAAYNMYDNLVTQSPNGTLIPSLASSWTISPDGTTYTFTLNQGVNFHSGNVLNASDVVFSAQRDIAIGQGVGLYWTSFLNSSGVKALSSSTVQFQLSRPFVPFLSTLSIFYIVDQQTVMKHLVNVSASSPEGDWGASWLSTNEAGSGPYMLENYQPGVSLTLSRFVGYWRGWTANPRPFNTVVYTVVTSDATVLSLAKEGQTEMTSPTRAYSTYQALQSQLGWTFQSEPSLYVFKIAMNTQKSPLNNLLFREAVALAFNYSSLNYFFPGETPATGEIPSAWEGYNPAVPALTQDLSAAKQALASSGVSPTVRTFTITYVSGFIPEQEMAEEFQKDLAQIGITVNIQPQTWLTMTQLATNKTTTPDFTVVATAATYPDPDSLLYPQYDTASQGTWNAFEWFSNATVDNLLNQERATVNPAQRTQILYQIQADIAQQYPDVFLLVEPYYLCYSPHIGGVVYSLGAWTYNGLYTMYYKP